MSLSANTIRAQMFKLKPLLSNSSLETIRRGQNMVGELMEFKHRKSVMIKEHAFENFDAAWVIPKEERRQGVILYIHGGGFVCGDIKYAKGFASTLATQCGVRTFCIGYRLAPENPFPAALEDALEAYRYLLKKGYSPKNITLCGESAGGGLCYSLCLKLSELGIEKPAAIIAISPWTDLTLSGESYQKNAECDPSMSKEILEFYRDCYEGEPTNPLVSPLFSELIEMPPSLIFVGDEEIMKSDSLLMHQRLVESGCDSRIYIKKERWHAYLLYGLSEDREDFAAVNQFLNRNVSPEKKLRWLKLDNAAKIYPAARSKSWSNVFRVSVSLKEDIDRVVLQSALDVTARRFPSICARLRKGVFWYYLEQLSSAPKICHEQSYPLTRMSRKDIRKCAFRVIAYKNRIALEVFHSLTDGTGAMIFLKTLTAEYILQKYSVYIPAELGVLGRLEEPSELELEDSFQKYAGPISASRKENDAYHISGTEEPQDFLNLTCFKIPVKEAIAAAKSHNVSLTVFLTSALMFAIQKIQAEQIPNRRRRKCIKILVPVNLRNIFESCSVRNFALYTNPEINPKEGEFDLDEICKIVHHHLKSETTKKKMAAKIAANISAERMLVVRLMPLFIKNFVMKAIYNAVGEKKSCLTMSNLGAISIPEKMQEFVERFDFVLGTQATTANNCGVLSYGDTLYINFIRSIREADLERNFFKVLQNQGLDVSVESNKS